MKPCTKCHIEKPLDEFYLRSGRRQSQCKHCYSLTSRKWGKANPDKKREYDRNWRAANPEYEREKTRRWREANLDKHATNSRRHRARKHNAPGPHATAEQVSALEQQCQCCGTTDKLQVDHIVALANGGSDSIKNLQILCGSCNSSKNTSEQCRLQHGN